MQVQDAHLTARLTTVEDTGPPMDPTRGTIVSHANLRGDGRKFNEFRKVRFKVNAVKSNSSDGSVYYEQGNNKIIVSIVGPKVSSVKGKNVNKKRCVIKCEYATSPFAAIGYRRSTKRDRRNIVEANTIRNIFEGVILTNLLPSSEVNIFVNVLQSDGSALCCCINAVSLALIHAGIPCIDFVIGTTCCSIANVNDLPKQSSQVSVHNLVDLNHTEVNSGYPQIEVAVLPNLSNRICFLRMANRVDMQIFESMLKTATTTCQATLKLFKSCLLDDHLSRVKKMTGRRDPIEDTNGTESEETH